MDHFLLMPYPRARKGQSLLESLMALIVGIILLGGIVQIWVWGNTQIVNRQREYERTRVTAGVSGDYNSYNSAWPPNRGTLDSLTEEEVLVDFPGGGK